MEKKMISVHAVTVHVYTVVIAILVLLLVAVSVKYWHLKASVHQFTNATILDMMQGSEEAKVADYGLIIASNIGGMKEADLQTYVTSLSKALNRDIVVLDKNKKVLADTRPSNKGSVYGYDKNQEIQKTIQDGVTRTFEERSVDYPTGVWETVTVVKNAKGEVTGAVLVSNVPLSQ